MHGRLAVRLGGGVVARENRRDGPPATFPTPPPTHSCPAPRLSSFTRSLYRTSLGFQTSRTAPWLSRRLAPSRPLLRHVADTKLAIIDDSGTPPRSDSPNSLIIPAPAGRRGATPRAGACSPRRILSLRSTVQATAECWLSSEAACLALKVHRVSPAGLLDELEVIGREAKLACERQKVGEPCWDQRLRLAIVGARSLRALERGPSSDTNWPGWPILCAFAALEGPDSCGAGRGW